ncbi:von Willebrand factor A domain-containing protein 7-like [Mercenaria mercenaria]|uniref:von Willebrand factor A domain-containing protein 7-like n=1 Tax=Mercenaria mercenaria TaxID=6596 RepID=UPI00234EC2B2|nr:von Willebrand factor A domain-containing protein 7-like [Mercenaria mercenaria]
MHTLSLRFLLILSQLLGCSYCFLPTRSSAVLETDFTMEDVIRKGMSNFTLEDAGADIELDDAKSREDAVTEIVEYFNTAERVHHGNPAWSFANEKILEGHGLLVSLRDRLIQTLLPHKPSYRAARETLGQIFHLLLKFYSNTNWVELGHTEIFKNLGIPDRPLMPVAPPSVDTCVACGEAVHRSCRHNILTDKFLTSGYFGQKQKGYYPLIDSTVQSHGKCRHGGVHDGGSSHTAVPGGINKQSECPEFSPHYFLHKNASMLATQHVRFYLFDQVYGLYHLLGHENFNQLLTVDLEASSVFVDVENETVRHELVQSLQSSEMHVLDTTSLEYACVHNEGTIIVVRYIDSSSKIQRNGPWQCDTRNIRVYNIQVLETVNSGSRQRRALGGLDIYHLIADIPVETVYNYHR